MEIWCLDDTGRDSWDWVGPPAWGRASFNSPEWGGGSSPVKTEPPQIVLLLHEGRDVDGMLDGVPLNPPLRPHLDEVTAAHLLQQARHPPPHQASMGSTRRLQLWEEESSGPWRSASRSPPPWAWQSSDLVRCGATSLPGHRDGQLFMTQELA